MGNIKTTQRNQPLHSSNNRLEFLNSIRSKFLRVIKFWLVVLVHRCMHFRRRSAKHHLEVVTNTFHTSLSSAAESPIVVTEEISPEMATRLFNVLQVAVPWIRLQLLAEFVGVQQSCEHVIHTHDHMFATSSAIAQPCIRIGMSRSKSERSQSVSEFCVESSSTAAQTTECLDNNQQMSFEFAEFFTGSETCFLLRAGFKASIADIAASNMQSIEFRWETNNSQASQACNT